MKKMLVLGLIMVGLTTGLTGCEGKKTTEYWDYNNETEQYELTKTEEEPIDGIFDEHVEVRFGEVQIENN